MPTQKYDVNLSATERKQLTKIVKSGKMPARTIMRANILLAVDRNGKSPMTVQEAALAFNTSATTVQKVRACYRERGLDATLNRKKRETPPVAAKVTGDVEARIIALACTDPPKGYAKWTLRLLADRSVKLGYVDSISHTQVGRILKKTNLSLT
ncbi:MAG: helix-turn-helix domain containing protein [Prevotella sp.]|nr:helix-turn-helix domain containing protein [Prevotella sp.]